MSWAAAWVMIVERMPDVVAWKCWGNQMMRG
jgi:hypothetical protein